MARILQLLERRFRLLEEQSDDYSWKSLEALEKGARGSANDFPAYHALRHLAGPQLEHPVWVKDWQAPNGYVHHKGTEAPSWTDEELHLAMAPQIRTWANGEFNKSTGYRSVRGKEGASYSVDDLVGTMHTMLQNILARGLDQGRALNNGWVGWVTPLIRQAASKGVGGSKELSNAVGRMADLERLTTVRTATADEALQIANSVGERFRKERSHVKNPQNPFGKWSPVVYALAMKIADALSGDEPDRGALAKLRDEVESTKEEMKIEADGVYGTDTGRRTIHTPHSSTGEAGDDLDKFKKTKIASISAPVGPNDESGMDVSDYRDDGSSEGAILDAEVIYNVLKIGRTSKQNGAEAAYLQARGLTPFTDDEYRYLIRLLAGPLHGRYPGQGTPSDPELIDGKPSAWVREGMPWLPEREDILKSMSADTASGSSEDADALLNKLTPRERDFVTLALGTNPDAGGKKLRNADIARLRDVSAVNVSRLFKNAMVRVGATSIQELLELAKGGSSGTTSVGDPLAKFQRWLKLYEEETSLDESVCSIDKALIRECIYAIGGLYYRHRILPLIWGRHAAA